jgi:hypothetical protein
MGWPPDVMRRQRLGDLWVVVNRQAELDADHKTAAGR